MDGSKLTIYIACHNRPELAREAIQSVLNQSDGTFCLKVSDNSTTDGMQSLMQSDFPNVEFVRRIPSVPPCAHGRAIVQECATEFLMIMHDDDKLAPSFVAEMLKFMAKHPEAGGYASNGVLIDRASVQKSDRFYLALRPFRIVVEPVWLARRWFSYATFSVAPYPSYIYRTERIDLNAIDVNRYGQYGDFVFIHQYLIKNGSLAWLNRPLYLYRTHAAQDSAAVSFASHVKLSRYMRQWHRPYAESNEFKLVRALHLAANAKAAGRTGRLRQLRRMAMRLIAATPAAALRKSVLKALSALERLRLTNTTAPAV